MLTQRVAASEELSEHERQVLRRFLDEAFDGDFGDDDWAHALGGVHYWLVGSDGVVSHASIVPRTIEYAGHPLSTGYVEAVATVATHRGQGHGSVVMRHAAAHIAEHYAIGALSTGEQGFYSRLGWELWRGPTFVDAPAGRTPTTDDDGGIMILRAPRTPYLDLHSAIVCDWRRGDVW